MSDLSWLFKPTYLCNLSAENSNKMTFSKYALACWDAEASLEVVMPLTFSLAHADRNRNQATQYHSHTLVWNATNTEKFNDKLLIS